MNIKIAEPPVFQRTYLSAILPGECFSPETSIECYSVDVYLMTNYDEVNEKYIVVNLYTGSRVDFTTSEADAMSVIRMRVDATAEPYLNSTKE